MAEAREEILRRIRAANHGDANNAAARQGDAGTSLADAEQAWGLLPRNYRRAATLTREDMLHRLVDRLRDYDALVELASPDGITAAIGRAAAAVGDRRVLVAAGFPLELLPSELNFTMDADFSPAALDGFAAVVTNATLGIAETGTLVLQNVPGQGRRAATLVPDLHICVLQAADVVETVPEAIERLAGTARLPTTFVSGPSATADIEMTRIKGVHGPRFLYVILVRGQGKV